jgi:hypothetical protein
MILQNTTQIKKYYVAGSESDSKTYAEKWGLLPSAPVKIVELYIASFDPNNASSENQQKLKKIKSDFFDKFKVGTQESVTMSSFDSKSQDSRIISLQQSLAIVEGKIKKERAERIAGKIVNGDLILNDLERAKQNIKAKIEDILAEMKTPEPVTSQRDVEPNYEQISNDERLSRIEEKAPRWVVEFLLCANENRKFDVNRQDLIDFIDINFFQKGSKPTAEQIINLIRSQYGDMLKKEFLESDEYCNESKVYEKPDVDFSKGYTLGDLARYLDYVNENITSNPSCDEQIKKHLKDISPFQFDMIISCYVLGYNIKSYNFNLDNLLQSEKQKVGLFKTKIIYSEHFIVSSYIALLRRLSKSQNLREKLFIFGQNLKNYIAKKTNNALSGQLQL